MTKRLPYAEIRSARDDLATLARRKGDGWLLVLFHLLMLLRFLTDSPTEREPRHDLYILF